MPAINSAICLFATFSLQCQSSKTKTFHFKSVGWTVTVPAHMNVEDSATTYKDLPHTTGSPSFMYSDKRLLQVLDTGGWRLNGPSLSAGIKPLEQGKDWNEIVQVIRSHYADTYNRDYLPKTNVDSVFSKETVDGKSFDKSAFKFTGPGWTQNIVIYSRAINGFEFHCVIAYPDSVKEKQFKDIFTTSRFR